MYISLHVSYFNPRPPRGGRRQQVRDFLWVLRISIHAPREGGDSLISFTMRTCSIFQSTPPARGATSVRCANRVWQHISIHAPREGGDRIRIYRCGNINFISIHAPREGGDRDGGLRADRARISIHAPREGGDGALMERERVYFEFQSTPPARGATAVSHPSRSCKTYFNPRPPRGGRQRQVRQTGGEPDDFNPRPPRGGRLSLLTCCAVFQHFNPRPPRGGRQQVVLF